MPTSAEVRNVLTIATGKPLYLDMAVNLARSFFYWHPATDIRFYMVTDQPAGLPADIAGRVNIIPVSPGEFGEGFAPKLRLDLLAPAGRTLFIDSDCLVFGDISFAFGQFAGHAVSVIGGYISGGDWFGDIASICRKYNVSRIPKFNGGVYYLEQGEKAAQVYQAARELERRYDEIGFVRLRNRPNDEVIMALAMELHGQSPVPDDGTIMSDLQACRGPYKMNVLTGHTRLTNPPPPFRFHNDWYPFAAVSPSIIHFLGYYTHHEPYLREVSRLRKTVAEGLHPVLAKLITALTVSLPVNAVSGFKNTFRSTFRFFFGYRKVKRSDRII